MREAMPRLASLRLAGWKSIRDTTLEFRPLNILIGANGAGKSNLISFLHFMGEMMEQRLQLQVGKVGGADSLLHFGAKHTSELQAEFRWSRIQSYPHFLLPIYSIKMIPAPVNTLVFSDELLRGARSDHFGANVPPTFSAAPPTIYETPLGQGHMESMLIKHLHGNRPLGTSPFISLLAWLERWKVYHFHDTSPTGPLRGDCLLNANRFLFADAANLPAMLYLYRERHATAYRQILAAVRAIAPFFDDFILEPLRLNPHNISLRWRAKGSDYEFGPHQLSDGTLRGIALFTLLLQPEADLPAMLVLDEPELGLHPSALAIVAELVKAVSTHSQVLLATQSTAFLDHFEAEDIVTVQLREGCSTFERLDSERLREWLEEYSLSELWERNVVGGGPY